MTGTRLLATAQTDAELKDEYEAKGWAAYLAYEPRVSPCDPNSMIGAWWFRGYDLAHDAEIRRM